MQHIHQAEGGHNELNEDTKCIRISLSSRINHQAQYTQEHIPRPRVIEGKDIDLFDDCKTLWVLLQTQIWFSS